MSSGMSGKGGLALGLAGAAGLLAVAAAPSAGQEAQGHREDAPVGLSLLFRDGAIAPLALVGPAPRYLQELDIVATVTTPSDQGIAPLHHTGDLATLDWTGVAFVEEDWRPAADGTFTRQRFYRGARWMNDRSHFILFARNAAGWPLGAPIVAHAGADDLQGPRGDFFVRRLVARQTTTGCVAVGDCSAATSFTAQGLVQLREALDAGQQARRIPAGATHLELFWSADPLRLRSVPLGAPTPDAPAPGFQVSVAPVSGPANGQFYQPGEAVTFRVTFRDGQGRSLYPGHDLPTYADFLAGNTGPGLRYADLAINPTLYYAFKKREGNLLVSLSGPTDRLKVPSRTVPPEDFFAPQATIATTALDGFTAVVAGVPPLPVTFGGFANPAIWQTPVNDLVTLTIPGDALPGTYVVAAKARRDSGGEALNRTETISIQVGTTQPTTFAPTTGPCNSCHQGPSALGSILHGLGDRRACYSCHTPIFFEPDNALDIRVHFVHSRSRRFPGDVRDCSLCHTSPPSGPPRGFP
jgi:hypothetical protein